MDTVVQLLGGEAKTVAFAILSGVIGFFAKAVYDLWTARRKDHLDRVNQQLKLFYGPLYALNQAGHHAWGAFRTTVRPQVRSFFGEHPPPTPEELEAWRLWMKTVFRPNHEKMLEIITKHSDLLIESDLPLPLQLFCAHVASYKAVFAKWDKGDYSQNTAVLNYPTEELGQYLARSFKALKARQAKLLGKDDGA
jgi:hypothetical protein